MADSRIVAISAVAGSVAGYLGVRLMNVRWRHRSRAEWVGRQMLLKQPPIRSWLGVGAFIFVLAMLPVGAVVRGPFNPPTLAMDAFLIGLGLVAVVVAWAIGRRTITIGPEAIDLSGTWGRRIAWSELASVDALKAAPDRTLLLFRDRHGKAIAVDSTYYGWEEFLEKVSEIAPEAGSKVARAMKRLETSP